MTVNSTTAKNAMLAALITDVGTVNTGKLIFLATATQLMIFTAVTFASPSAGAVTFTATGSADNLATGTATTVQLTKTDGTTIIATFASGEITVGAVTLHGTGSLTSGSISIA